MAEKNDLELIDEILTAAKMQVLKLNLMKFSRKNFPAKTKFESLMVKLEATGNWKMINVAYTHLVDILKIFVSKYCSSEDEAFIEQPDESEPKIEDVLKTYGNSAENLWMKGVVEVTGEKKVQDVSGVTPGAVDEHELQFYIAKENDEPKIFGPTGQIFKTNEGMLTKVVKLAGLYSDGIRDKSALMNLNKQVEEQFLKEGLKDEDAAVGLSPSLVLARAFKKLDADK